MVTQSKPKPIERWPVNACVHCHDATDTLSYWIGGHGYVPCCRDNAACLKRQEAAK